MKRNLLFFMAIFVISFLVLFFVNTGFNPKFRWEYIQSFLLAVIFTSNLFWPRIRKISLFLSVVFILTMVVLFTLERFDMANVFGSTAVGIVFLLLLCYLPQLIKKGYIEKL